MTNLQFITGVRFYKSALEQLNHITFIYDPAWDVNNARVPTLPMCFFYVKNMHEVMSAEVSTKQMLFYNSNSEGTSSDSDAGLLNVVADNIVTKPKTYKLDLIIPYSDLTLLNQSYVYNANTFNAINSQMIGIKQTSAWAFMDNAIVKTWKNLLRSLMITEHGSTSLSTEQIDSIISQPDYNKNSLELMWRLRRVLKIKLWNSWTYKYVSITDLDVTKEGTENGVYEATLTVQEMPIVTLTKSSDLSKASRFTYKNSFLENQGKKLIEALNLMGIKGERNDNNIGQN